MTTLALVVIGGLTILLGGFSIRHNIKAIFFGDLGAAGLNLNSSEQAQLDSLHSKDTDSDGLSDYDELYAYDTSPYLADSDSDGTTDSSEVAAGTDPNCSGASCLQTRVGSNTNSSSSTVNTNSGAVTTDAALASLGSNPTAQEVRTLLLNAGVSQQVLDQTDDATLLQLYQQTIGETSTTTTSTNQAVDANYADLLETTTTTTTTQDLENLTPEQIRELLISSGVDPEILSQVNDADLLVIYKKALGEAQTETNQ